MSNTSENIICPNCGAQASGNYCYQCGQETHLHKETFWALVMHFIGHYFHYDSKFWQTMKALWFSPGKLTIAYMNKQRMRYIPPISLYIFITAVFFLLFTLTSPKKHGAKPTDTVRKNGVYIVNPSKNDDDISITYQTDSVNTFFGEKLTLIAKEHGNVKEYFQEKLTHDLPKLFFFMIPVMALFLQLLFARRKTLLFVDHAIFALHYQSFWFSLFMLSFIKFTPLFKVVFLPLLLVVAFFYMIKAMKTVYQIGTMRSFFNCIIVSFGYLMFLSVFIFIEFLIVLATA